MSAFARSTDPDTSHEAANAMSDARITELQQAALDALKALGGSGTNDDIVEQSGVDWNTITPRMRPLLRKGLVSIEGKRRSTRTGRKQIIWALTTS